MNFAKIMFGGLWLLCFSRIKPASGFTQLKTSALTPVLKATTKDLVQSFGASVSLGFNDFHTTLIEMSKDHAKLKNAANRLQKKLEKTKEIEAKIVLLEQINKEIDILNQSLSREEAEARKLIENLMLNLLLAGAKVGNVDLVKRMIKNGVNINAKLQFGKTALQTTVDEAKIAEKKGYQDSAKKHREIQDLLINNGAGNEDKTKKGQANDQKDSTTSILEKYYELGHIPSAKSDRPYAQVEEPNRQVNNKLSEISKIKKNIEGMQFKAQWIKDDIPRNKNGPKSSLEAEMQEVQKLAKELESKALMHFVNIDDADSARILLANKADANAKDQGKTALFYSTQKRYLEPLKALLDHNADTEIKTFFGFTPLAMAAINGDLQIAVELINNNAKIDVKTFFGFTPLDFARYHENHEMVELLEKFEADSKADVSMSGQNL